VRKRIIILAAIATLCGAPLVGCGPAPDPLGSVLDALGNQVTTIIQNATANAEAAVASAAGQVQELINNAQSAFAQDLNTAYSDATALETSTVNNITALIADLENGAATLLESATTDAQQLINSLPFTNKNPQVTSYTPQFVAAPASGMVDVTVRGNFFWAFQKQLKPSLQVDGTTISASDLETQSLGFLVPATDFSGSAGALSPISLQLNIPYKTGVIFHSVKPGTFFLLVTVLPSSPVTSLTLSTVNRQNSTATKNLDFPNGIGPGIHQDSFDCSTKDVTYPSIGADPGWTIIPSTVTVNYLENKNPDEATVKLDVNNGSQIVFEIITDGNCFLGISTGSGDVTIYLSYTEEQPVTTSSPVTKSLAIGWGDQLVEPVAQGDWTLTAQLFNGSTVQFNGTNVSNEYISVQDDGSTIQIDTPATSSLMP
jgi:hypothetical protein